MKKMLLASFVGAILIFMWQFLSYAALNLHEPAQRYTEKQDAILEYLGSQGIAEGGYIVPNVPPGASEAQREAYMKQAEGKPWASIQYHNAMDTRMAPNMIRGFIVDMIIVWLFCWMMMKMQVVSFRNVLLSALAVGLIVFMNGHYTGAIWYKFFDTTQHLIDYIVSWGLVGLWLGWYLPRGRSERVVRKDEVRSYEMAS